MKKVFEFREDRSHPPPYPFASRSLTTPTQRCWYCGGGQVPGYGGGWETERNEVDSVCVLGGFGNGKVIKQSHLKVALLDDKAVPSSGAELSRRLISSLKWIGSSSPSQQVPLKRLFCTQRRVSNSTDTQTNIQKEVELWT